MAREIATWSIVILTLIFTIVSLRGITADKTTFKERRIYSYLFYVSFPTLIMAAQII